MFRTLTENLEKLEMKQALNEAFENILLEESDDILEDIIELDDDDLNSVDLDDLDDIDDDLEDDEEFGDIVLDEDECSIDDIDVELSEEVLLEYLGL